MILTNHYQNAYVTADIDAAVKVLSDQFGVGDNAFVMDVTQTFATLDGEGEGTLRLGFIQMGHLQYELIQPVSGNVRLYAEAVRPDRPLTFHHVAMRVDDVDVVAAESEKHGRQVVLSGSAPDMGLRFLYVDARGTLGHYLEYVSAPDAFWGAMTGG